ncbi:Hint domain-containing protein [Xinfangfangia sp. D13-10-4-6]|uniref:Hint domain-containing protein n=1 Tax=Pseudogemmobacter hezensis TaxID=2737662 RepID=UPI001554D33D|nr:Hint domain-containing protein [Pseudogemmobacter hezensis]NPD16467.1 Hint domain-containing protein [Pseudogemmobacter hezensis]
MATFEFFITGAQIGTYSWANGQGNGNEMVVTVSGVQPLGTANDLYRVVVTQANEGDTSFRNGQWVSVYTWSESNPAGTLVLSQLNPQDDMYQGRASGHSYQIFSYSQNVIIDLRGVGQGTTHYGAEQNEALSEKLPFSGLAKTPQELLPPVIPCFVDGTGILTRRGMVPVGELRPGDKVWTRGHGMQPIRWIGSSQTCGIAHLAPVRFAAGVLGNERPVWLSQQHRVLLSGWQAQLNFGEDEVLVAALHLVDGDRIRLESRPLVRYWHIACASHQILCADGMLAESLYPGQMAAAAMAPEARAELQALFPDHFPPQPEHKAVPGLLRPAQKGHAVPQTSRPCLNRREAALFSLD